MVHNKVNKINKISLSADEWTYRTHVCPQNENIFFMFVSKHSSRQFRFRRDQLLRNANVVCKNRNKICRMWILDGSKMNMTQDSPLNRIKLMENAKRWGGHILWLASGWDHNVIVSCLKPKFKSIISSNSRCTVFMWDGKKSTIVTRFVDHSKVSGQNW